MYQLERVEFRLLVAKTLADDRMFSSNFGTSSLGLSIKSNSP